MNVVILQPSYIPWRGYFDQIRRADLFVFFDDVQYDRRGWRNRNQIKTSHGKQWLTIPVHSSGTREGLLIKDVRIDLSKPWGKTHWKALTCAYARAPHFRRYAPLLEAFYRRSDSRLADFTVDLTVALSREIGIGRTRFMRSSEIPRATDGRTDRLVQILRHVGATHYISGPSAREYVEDHKFAEAGISIEYMSYGYSEYPQLFPPYDPRVSILDLLFMVGADALSYITQPEETARERP